MRHARIERSSAANHWRRMLGAEEPDRKIHEWYIKRAEDRHHGRNHRGLTAGRKPPQHQVADVNQPEHQRGGEPDVPGSPPNSPNRPRPDGTRDQNYGAEHYTNFSSDQG